VKRHSAAEAEEAQRNVKRMAEQSEKLLTGAGPGDDDDGDPVVILGRRIGRGLGWVTAAGLMVYLFLTYVVK
jgi:hypothetical protein